MSEVTRKIGWLVPLGGLAVALSACAGALPPRSGDEMPAPQESARSATAPKSTEATAKVAARAVPVRRAPTPSDDFPSVRLHMLDAAGSWTGVAARVWTVPDPVRNDDEYRVRFEAGCRCQAFLFAIDADDDSISLLYPNPLEPARLLSPGETVEIPSSNSYTLRAVGGGGWDVLKLFVLERPTSFPKPSSDFWRATPSAPDPVNELVTFLASLGDNRWATAATALQIVE